MVVVQESSAEQIASQPIGSAESGSGFPLKGVTVSGVER